MVKACNQLDRHERWHHQAAKKLDVKLSND
jgi:hypothetical protein